MTALFIIIPLMHIDCIYADERNDDEKGGHVARCLTASHVHPALICSYVALWDKSPRQCKWLRHAYH